MDFTCTHCNDVFTSKDAWDNWYQATQHAKTTGHAVVDQNRLALQVGPKLHGITMDGCTHPENNQERDFYWHDGEQYRETICHGCGETIDHRKVS